MKSAKQFAKSVLPNSVTSRWTEWRIAQTVRRNAVENRDRTAYEVFDEVYRKNQWGGKRGELFSGSGSSGAAARAYASLINDFIRNNAIASVLDIGCGDYRVGREIDCERYTGIDVAASVINSNVERFGSPTRTFMCLDAAGPERLPDADLCLVRQVLQHLSNAQIAAILNKLEKFAHVLVTEHYPSDEDFVSANKDKVHGADTRLYSGSGVYLDQPPFALKTELLLESPAPATGDVHSRGYIRTFRLRYER